MGRITLNLFFDYNDYEDSIEWKMLTKDGEVLSVWDAEEKGLVRIVKLEEIGRLKRVVSIEVLKPKEIKYIIRISAVDGETFFKLHKLALYQKELERNPNKNLFLFIK